MYGKEEEGGSLLFLRIGLREGEVHDRGLAFGGLEVFRSRALMVVGMANSKNMRPGRMRWILFY